jgi:hypothetical protein
VTGTRPLRIIDTEIDLTNLAIQVCQTMVNTALAQRVVLLEAGWPPGHAMCGAFDESAAFWAAQVKHQQKALYRLFEERGRA